MIKYAMWGLLVTSAVLLVVTILRNRKAGRVLSSVCLNIVFAAFMLYVLNLLNGYTHIEIPMNIPTIVTVSLLGIPGLFLLVCLKLSLV